MRKSKPIVVVGSMFPLSVAIRIRPRVKFMFLYWGVPPTAVFGTPAS